MSLYLTVHNEVLSLFPFWCNKVCFGRRRKRLWVWEGLCKENMDSHLCQTVRREGLRFLEAKWWHLWKELFVVGFHHLEMEGYALSSQ